MKDDRMIRIYVRCFSVFKEAFGKDKIEMIIPKDYTIEQLESRIRGELPENLKQLAFRIAVNQEFSMPSDVLKQDDEAGLISPTQGG